MRLPWRFQSLTLNATRDIMLIILIMLSVSPMYVCVCEVVTDQEIITAIHQGCQSVPELRSQLGCGKQCGRCIPTVRNLLRQQRQRPMQQTALRAHTGHRSNMEAAHPVI